jgi:adenylyl- and sulfurtransferase ThiI
MIENKLQNKTKQRKTINNNLNQIFSIQNFSSQVHWKKKNEKGESKALKPLTFERQTKKQTFQKKT